MRSDMKRNVISDVCSEELGHGRMSDVFMLLSIVEQKKVKQYNQSC